MPIMSQSEPYRAGTSNADRTRGGRGLPLALTALLLVGLLGLLAGGAGASPVPASTAAGHGYLVTFTENGLPAGTNWSVTVGGTTVYSHTSSAVFNETNGTYLFTIGSVGGYAVSRNTGTVTVSGSDQTVAVAFTPSSSTVSSLERIYFGLPLWLWIVILIVVVLLIAAGAAAASRPTETPVATTTTVQQTAPATPVVTQPVSPTTRETTTRETTPDGGMKETTVREQTGGPTVRTTPAPTNTETTTTTVENNPPP